VKCETVRQKMALHVGRDLPEHEVAELTEHIAACGNCAAELDVLWQMQAVFKDVAELQPSLLPANFAAGVVALTSATNGDRPRPRGFGWLRIGWMPVTAVGALVVVFLVSVWLFTDRGGPAGSSPIVEGSSRVVAPDGTPQPPVVMWADLVERYGSRIDGPVPLARWEPPDAPGVFVIMHRPDPQGTPESYRLDYCGESARFGAYRGSPWTWQRERRLLSRAGSWDNVYIAVITLPGSSGSERRRIEKTLIEEYNPYFNIRNGA